MFASFKTPYFIITHKGSSFLVNASTGKTVISSKSAALIRFVSWFVVGPVSTEGDSSDPAARWAPQA